MNLRGTLTVTVFAVFLALTFQPAHSLQCWTCGSVVQKWCNDPFNTTAAVGGEIGCGVLPVCVKLKGTIGRVPIVARSCGPKNACELPEAKAYEYCGTCERDGCNDATNSGPALLLVAVLAVVSLIMRL